MQKQSATIFVCVNRRTAGEPSCAGRGSLALLDTLRAAVKAGRLDIAIEETVCLGHCAKGPNVRIKGGAIFHGVDDERLAEIVRAAITSD